MSLQRSSYDDMITQYYATMSPSDLRQMIMLEFAELFDLTAKDWHISLQTNSVLTLLELRTLVLKKAIDIILSFIYNYRGKEDVDPTKTVRAIEIILISFDTMMLMQIQKKKYAHIIRFLLENNPLLLRLLVERLPTWFYTEEDDTDLTYAAVTNLVHLSKKQLHKALPVILRIFVNPTNQNPEGLFNKRYSVATSRRLKADVSEWQTILQVIGL